MEEFTILKTDQFQSGLGGKKITRVKELKKW